MKNVKELIKELIDQSAKLVDIFGDMVNTWNEAEDTLSDEDFEKFCDAFKGYPLDNSIDCTQFDFMAWTNRLWDIYNN